MKEKYALICSNEDFFQMMSSLTVQDNCIEEDLMPSNEQPCHRLSTSVLRNGVGGVIAAQARFSRDGNGVYSWLAYEERAIKSLIVAAESSYPLREI